MLAQPLVVQENLSGRKMNVSCYTSLQKVSVLCFAVLLEPLKYFNE